MIKVNLLGGAKKIVGKSCIEIHTDSTNIKKILSNLTDLSEDSKKILNNNVIIAINGVDSSVLNGQETEVKSGDIVTIVTIVHGG